jgi:hypothetical protein
MRGFEVTRIASKYQGSFREAKNTESTNLYKEKLSAIRLAAF